LIGLVGKLHVASRGAEGPGEVELPIRGGRERFIAYSDRPIPVGASVIVIEQLPGRSVQVVLWDEPLLMPLD
jgi:hypothetical protein